MKKLGLIISLLSIFSSQAQDVHFSFSEFSGQNLNPSQSGSEDFLTLRLNYRTQWGSVGSAFKTTSAGFDLALVKQKRTRSVNLSKGWFGLGVNMFSDAAGNLPFKSNHVGLNLAYHQPVSSRSILSMGVYGAYQERVLESLEGRWPSQFDGSYYDPTLSSGEADVSQKFSFIDSGVGLSYIFHRFRKKEYGDNNFSFYAGASMYHLSRPVYSFIQNSDERLRFRTSVYLKSIIGLGSEGVSLVPILTYSNQIISNEVILGSYLKYYDVAVGLFVRTDDSFVAKALYETDLLTVGVAFDLIVSKLGYSSRNGAIEFCLLYKIPSKIRGRGCYIPS